MKASSRSGPPLGVMEVMVGCGFYLTESFYNVVLQKSTPLKIRQFILFYQ
jgi:hypothetical protein